MTVIKSKLYRFLKICCNTLERTLLIAKVCYMNNTSEFF